jgi:hypothetical protein
MFAFHFRQRTLMVVGIVACTFQVLPKCRFHGDVLQRESVPICYGLIRLDAPQVQYKYLMAKDSLFPNCNDPVLGGCCVDLDKPTTLKNLCQRCNTAQTAWSLSQR